MARAKTSPKNRKPKTARPDFYQEVTGRVIAKLAAGTAPWRHPWNSYGLARNIASGNVYTGINAFMLNFLSPHPVPYYLTFKQAKDLGGSIRKGAKSERVYFFKTLHRDGDGRTIQPERASELAGSGQEVKRIPFLRSFCVFNVADVEGIDFGIPTPATTDHQPIQECEDLIHRAAGRIPTILNKVVGQAWYEPRRDIINLPALGSFRSPQEYYSTLFHELSHSTGHVSRLNRSGVAGQINPGGADYAREELIAEMGAAFLCAHTGIDAEEVTDNNAAYLAAWIERLREDKQLVFRAAAAAQRSTDYLLGVEP